MLFSRGDAGKKEKEKPTIERIEAGLEKSDAFPSDVTLTEGPTEFAAPRKIARENASQIHEIFGAYQAAETDLPKHPAEYLKYWPGYQGYIGDFEARSAIRHDGQYLIRLEDVKDKTNILICSGEPLRHDKQWRRPGMPDEAIKDSNPVIRVRTHVVEKDKRGFFSIEDDYCFESVEDLLSFYVFHGEKSKLAAQLRYAVPRRIFQFKPHYIERIKKLGAGAFGDVSLAAISRPGLLNKRAVVKAVKLGLTNTAELSQKLIEEGRCMLNLNHPNVIQIYGWCLDSHPLMLLFEYMPCGALDLFLLENFECTSVRHLVRFALDAAQGLAYIHSQNLIHRDIAARNCLLTKKGKVKLADFGLCVRGRFFRMRKAERLPTRYVAPESLIYFVFVPKSDCYTYGNLLFEIFSGGSMPYENLTSPEIRERILHGLTNKMPSRTPDSLLRFTEDRIWAYALAERPNAYEIVEFLQNVLKGVKNEAMETTVAEEKEDYTHNEDNARKRTRRRKLRREEVLEDFCPTQEDLAA
ncbi:unnamed protein product [Caenorhabditis auriculariae]|uniref:Protein kinase domain-containing protein n=1 Tax=Caenorhabditis auriculariae TaxID=2777116 RepID=A0A8S1HI56_9PELO|nr:unnamed protein product [Caenorhabditis auriculariae]